MTDSALDKKRNLEYILFAEFDNKLGSVLKYQYPNAIPGLDFINLATLMIPDNIEKCLGKVEFTYFLLYYNSTTHKYELVPPLNNINKELDILYFINICIAKSEPDNERGAVIKSVAVGSKFPDFFKWKPFLTIFLEDLMDRSRIKKTYEDNNNNNRYCINIISDFFTRINKINFLDISNKNLYQEIIQSINDGTNEQKIINSILEKFKSSLERNNNLLKRGKITFSNDLVNYFLSMEIAPTNSQKANHKIPICQKLLLDSYIQTNIDYCKHALKVIKDINLKVSNIEEIKTILIFSTKTSKDYLCQLIFSISYLLSGISLNKDPSSNQIYSFPYIDISMINLLKNFIQSFSHNKLKFIIGTANPIFKIQEDIYDIFYDLDEDNIYTSSKHKTKEIDWKKQTLKIFTKSYKINEGINSLSHGLNSVKLKNKSESSFAPLTSIINGNNNNHNHTSFFNLSSDASSLKSEYPHSTLMNSFINMLITEQHDNKTILNVLKRIQILQLIPLLKPITIKEIDSDMVFDLTKIYHDTYGDLIYFNELFDKTILKYIKLLYILYEVTEMITSWNLAPSSTISYDTLTKKINELQEIIRQSLLNFNSDDAAATCTRKLLYVCMNFPPLDILSHIDPKYKDTRNFDSNIFYNRILYYGHRQSFVSNNSEIQQTNSLNQSATMYSVIDKFVETVTFNLFNKVLSFDLKLEQKHNSSLVERVPTVSNPSLFLSPFKKRNKSGITRSLSFRNLLSLKVNASQDFKSRGYQEIIKKEDVSLKNQISSKSSVFKSSTSSFPPKVLKKSASMESIRESFNKSKYGKPEDSSSLHSLDTKIEEIKSMVYEILRMLDADKMLGSIIMWNYLNKEIKSQLDIYKQKSGPHKKFMSNDNNICKSSIFQKNDENSNISLDKHGSISKNSIISSLNMMASIYELEGASNKASEYVDSFKKENEEEMEDDNDKEEEIEESEEEEIFYEIEYL